MNPIKKSDFFQPVCGISSIYGALKTSQAALVVKNPPANARDNAGFIRSLGRKDPWEGEMAAHASIIAWRIPWTEEPGGVQSMGSQRVGHD